MATYNVSNANVTVPAVGVTVTLGQDVAGNVQIALGGNDYFSIDTQDPVAPTIVGLTHDTGISNTDKISYDPTLSLNGVETGGTPQFSFDNGYTWSQSDVPPVQGPVSVRVRQLDAAGNGSLASRRLPSPTTRRSRPRAWHCFMTRASPATTSRPIPVYVLAGRSRGPWSSTTWTTPAGRRPTRRAATRSTSRSRSARPTSPAT